MARGFFDGCSLSDTLGLFFRAFGLNTVIFRVSLLIQLECGNIQTRKTPNTDTFHRVIFLFLAHIITFVMRCAILYHLYNLKNVKNTHGGMLIFTFFKLYKWYQIAQRTTFVSTMFFGREHANYYSYGQVLHCAKSVQIRSFFWTVFSCIRSISPYSVRLRENKDQKKLRIWIHFTQSYSR